MSNVLYVDQDNFESEVILSASPVLVDFTAVWCGPCKMIAPIIEQLHSEWQGKVKVFKCDADQNPEILQRYGIMGIPTIMLFKDGKIVERVTGYQTKDKLVAKMVRHVSN